MIDHNHALTIVLGVITVATVFMSFKEFSPAGLILMITGFGLVMGGIGVFGV